MHRQLIAIAAAAAACAAIASGADRAAAQPAPSAPDSGSTAPDQGTAAPPPDDSAPAQPAPGPATAAPTPAAAAGAASADSDAAGEVGDQAISAEIGAAAGGRVTVGGLRLTGQYLYQLTDEDWFDGAAGFTFGSGSPACFRDRNNKVVCQHGVAEGTGVELTASVRRVYAAQGAFRPFARVGVGLGLARFSADDINGVTIPAHFGGGVRFNASPGIAVVAEGDLDIGFASFSRGLGSQPQLGFAIAAGAEFRLR